MIDAALEAHIAAIKSPVRRRDAEALIAMMGDVTGLEPRLEGTIIAFGTYHYEYASGRSGDAPAAAFASRGATTAVYLSDGVGTPAVTPFDLHARYFGERTDGLSPRGGEDLIVATMR